LQFDIPAAGDTGENRFAGRSCLPGNRALDLLGAQAGDAFDVSPIRLRFFRAFENMRGDAAFLQRFAEFDAQKA
jgi:hypothetical protein